MEKAEIIHWLLQGDPAVQYQTSRDLTDTKPEQLDEIRQRIATEGWGARLLSLQDEKGMWGGGIYTPKWTSTHYTLKTLKELDLPPDNAQAQKACEVLLEHGAYTDGGINFFRSLKHGEVCVSGMMLSQLVYFQIADTRIDRIVDFLLENQMPGGGWNCQSFDGAIHGSFHSTLSVLEGLNEFSKSKLVEKPSIRDAVHKAHEFLLMHHLFRSDKTGAIVDPRMLRFPFPPYWKYDIMRALDYFQQINMPHDPRFCDAIQVLKKKSKNGQWKMNSRYSGKIYFDLEPIGLPSRINTLRAMRILKWWQRRPEHIEDCTEVVQSVY